MYLIVIVLVVLSSEKVVLNSTYPRTSTWSPAKPAKHPLYGLNWLGDNCKLVNVPQNITSAELLWSIKTLCTIRPTVTTYITTGSSSWGTTPGQNSWSKKWASEDDQASSYPGTSQLACILYFSSSFHFYVKIYTNSNQIYLKKKVLKP